MDDYAAYVRKLKSNIRPEALARATASIERKARRKTAKSVGKVLATAAGLGLGTALIVAGLRGKPPVVSARPGRTQRGG